jgi:hypothetical protein
MAMISVGDVLVDGAVLDAFFSCDLDACAGCCCVEGELGAPLTPAEAALLEHPPGQLLRMLPEKSARWIARHGSVEVYQGTLYTRTVDSRECVFAVERDRVTLCAIEIAFREGIAGYNKPLSCRLFPIRVRKKFGLAYLVYEEHAMCRPARRLGGELRMPLVDYLSTALEELYGREWVESLAAFRKPSSKS